MKRTMHLRRHMSPMVRPVRLWRSGRACGRAATDPTCRALVGLGGPSGVNAECGGAAAALAEAAGDSANVNAGADQFSGAVVPKVLQGGVNAKAGGHAFVALGHAFGI